MDEKVLHKEEIKTEHPVALSEDDSNRLAALRAYSEGEKIKSTNVEEMLALWDR